VPKYPLIAAPRELAIWVDDQFIGRFGIPVGELRIEVRDWDEESEVWIERARWRISSDGEELKW